MTITATYTSSEYEPEKITARYVRFDRAASSYRWAECAPGKFGWLWDFRQGTCAGTDLPAAVRDEAIARYGAWPAYAEWPL